MSITTGPPQMYAEPHAALYPSGMVKRVLMGIQELRLRVGDFTKAVEERGEHVVLSKRGKPFAVTVPIDWYRTAAQAVDDPTEY